MSTHKIQFTVQDIYELHTQLENAFVLSSGVRDENLLASAVNTPFQTFMEKRFIPIHLRQSSTIMLWLSQQSSFYRWKQTNSIA